MAGRGNKETTAVRSAGGQASHFIAGGLEKARASVTAVPRQSRATGSMSLAEHEIDWVPVIMYHRVVPERPEDDRLGMAISTQEFSEQMDFLETHGYDVVPISELVANRNELGRRRAAITFDDGYADFLDNALPILKRHRFTATVFVVTSEISGFNSWDVDHTAPVPLMTKPQLIRLHAEGMEIGSHSVTHRPLTEIPRAQLNHELNKSKKCLEAIVDEPVASFCYPFGKSNAEMETIVRESGYSLSCGIEQTPNRVFNLSRIDGARCRGADLRWRLSISGLLFRARTSRINRLRKALRGKSRRRGRTQPSTVPE